MSRPGLIVLAGGRSSRMGRDKALLPFGGETLLERVLHRLVPVAGERRVVCRAAQELPPLPSDVVVVHDEVEGLGPLGGLGPGLRGGGADRWFVTSCDAPFVRPELVELLERRLGTARIAVPRAGGYHQPLAALYRSDVLADLDELVAERRLRPFFLFERVETVVLEEDELRSVDPELESFLNCNDPEAYRAALRRAGLAEAGS